MKPLPCTSHVALKLSLALITSLYSSSVLCAASLPNYDISNAMKEVTPPKAPQRSEKPTPLSIIQEEEKPLTLAEGEKMLIKDYRIVDSDTIDRQLFEPVLSTYRNKELSMRDINELAAKISQICKDQGYLLAKAYVPKQDAREGILTIKLILGKSGKISSTNHSAVQDSIIQNTLEYALVQDEAISQSSLERAILLIKDTPSAKLPTLTIAPGSSYGSSDLSFTTEAAERFEGYITGDNYGSKYTGKTKASAGASINSPFGIGDKLSLSGSQSSGADLQNGKVAYAFPLYSNGLRGELSVSKTTYELGDEYRDLDALGNAKTYEGVISYPMMRTQQVSYYLALRMTHKDLKDEIRSTDTTIPKKINVAALEVTRDAYGTLFGLNAFTTMTGSLNYGHLEINDDEQKALNEAGADTTGNYSKAAISMMSNLALNETFSLAGSLKLQKALGNKNLDGSEQLSISGIDGVRVFPDSEWTADSGYVLGLELKYLLPSFEGINHNAGIFVDTGRGWIENAGYTDQESRSLNDIGLSYTVNYKTIFAKAQLARIVGNEDVTVEKSYNTRILCQIGASF